MNTATSRKGYNCDSDNSVTNPPGVSETGSSPQLLGDGAMSERFYGARWAADRGGVEGDAGRAPVSGCLGAGNAADLRQGR
jgi:hypothetical protein